jgi:hypothetical protein
VRIGVARLDGTLFGIEVDPPLQAIMLVSGAFGKEGAEGVDVGRDVLRFQARGQGAIEEARSRVRRPVQTARVAVQRLVFGREMGSEIDDVEARLRGKLEREIERFSGSH